MVVVPWLRVATPWNVAVLLPGPTSRDQLPTVGLTLVSVVTAKQLLCGLLHSDPQVKVLAPVGTVEVELAYFTVKSKPALTLLLDSVGRISLGFVLRLTFYTVVCTTFFGERQQVLGWRQTR